MPIDPQTRAAFEALSTPLIGDCMGRNPGILGVRPYHGTARVAGEAFTVYTRPGDNLAIHQALELIQPGQVLVVDGGGAIDRALVGELMMSYAKSRGVTGAVIFGAVRDLAYFRDSGFPCFACGNTHRGPFRTGHGKLQVTLAVGGQVVHPGDLVVGDEDGVLAIPADEVTSVLKMAQELAAKEEQDKASILAGTWDRSWVPR